MENTPVMDSNLQTVSMCQDNKSILNTGLWVWQVARCIKYKIYVEHLTHQQGKHN